MVVRMVPERDFKRPGCGEGCRVVKALVPGVFGRSELLLHDPEAHELYGAACALESGLNVNAMHTVATGCLTVNLKTFDVTVAGQLVYPSPTEARILVYLARRLGRLVSHEEIVREIWPNDSSTRAHTLRVNITRLRRHLGAAAPLVVTRGGQGYFLDAVNPGEIAPLRLSPYAQRPPGRWARDWERCRNCGETAKPHHTHGYCYRWACQRVWKAERERQTSEGAS